MYKRQDQLGVRLVDPAPRIDRDGCRAFTPEYNPYGLTGAGADVFAIAVMAYQLATGVQPFAGRPRVIGPHDAPSGRPDQLDPPVSTALAFDVADPPPPVNRGARRLGDAAAAFVDGVLMSRPPALPPWALDHGEALQMLVDATWRSIRLRREHLGDGQWRLHVTNAHDLSAVRVRVTDSSAWMTGAPCTDDGTIGTGDDSRHGLILEGTRGELRRLLAILRRLPYLGAVDPSVRGVEGRVTSWCGARDGDWMLLDHEMATLEPGHRPALPVGALIDPERFDFSGQRVHPTSGDAGVRRIRLEAEWGLSGLWDDTPDSDRCFQSIDLEELLMTGALAARIEAWTERLEALRLRSSYPPDWQFESETDEQHWVDDGALIAADLRRELGASYVVDYYVWGRPVPMPPEPARDGGGPTP